MNNSATTLRDVREGLRRLWSLVPVGGTLPEDIWGKRHRFLLGLTWFHAGIITLVGPIFGYSWEFSVEALLRDETVLHTVVEGLIVALFAALGCWKGASRTVRSTIIGFGLMSSSAILVHLSGGYIELHFHFFVMLAFLALYQDWTPYLLAISYVAIHHGVVGVLWPEEVYNHPAALNAPWTWAGIHAFFVLWASAASVIAWRFNEKAEEKLQARYAELRALYEISQYILSSPDLRIVLDGILEKALSVGRFDIGNIRLLDPTGQNFEMAASRGYRDPENIERHHRTVIDAASGRLTARVVTFLEPLVEENVGAVAGLRTLKREMVRSAVVVPVRAGKELLGVIQLGSRTPRKFLPDEVHLLDAIGNQTGIAIQKSRLLEQAQRRAQEQAALSAIALAMSQSLKIDEILHVALDRTLEVMGRDIGFIRIRDDDTAYLRLVAHRGISERYAQCLVKREQPGQIAARVLATGETVASNEPSPGDVLEETWQEGIRSAVRAPIGVQGRVVGVMTVASRNVRAFGSQEVELLNVIGNVIGTSVGNAWLYKEMEQRAQEQEALNAIATAANQSLDLDEIFSVALNKVLEVTGRERGTVRLKDPVAGGVRLFAHHGLSQQEVESLRHKGPHKSDRVFSTGEPEIIDDTAGEWVGDDAQVKLQGSRSVGWFPIMIHAEVVGVLAISSRQKMPFSPREIKLLRAVGHILGNAAGNARLFKETQGNLERIRALQDIDRAITSTLDFRSILDVLLQKIQLSLPYSAATVRMFNGESGLLEPVACRNLGEAEWKEERWRGGRGSPNIVFEARAPVMVRNIQNHPRTRDPEFYRKHGLVSYLGIPLMVKNEILGVLSFYTKEEHEFSKAEVDFLTTLAGQAAVAIQNSQLYEGMAKLADDLSKSNRVKDEFLSVMSHELRTPLNVVMGHAAMIQDGMLGEINAEQMGALNKIMDRARDQLTMINSILQATQIEAEGARVVYREAHLGDFFKDLRASYAAPLRKEVSFEWDYPAKLPVINTDGEKLKCVLQNLINNAIKFTEKGRVRVSACFKEANGQEMAEFKVMDTGIGIPQQALPFIFDRFRQVDSSETRIYGGVGLGLYIVKKYTELLGGKVEVESEPGRGSCFTVTIPCGGFGSELGDKLQDAATEEGFMNGQSKQWSGTAKESNPHGKVQ